MLVEQSGWPICRAGLVFEEQGRDLHVILSTTDDRLLICNTIGRWVLEQCDGKSSVTQIAESLASLFPQIAATRISADLESFFDMAAQGGAIVWK